MESLFEKLGTICFEPSIMRDKILFGELFLSQDGNITRDYECPSLCLAEWMILVPEAYKRQVSIGTKKIANEMLDSKSTESTKEIFIAKLILWVHENLVPRQVQFERFK